MQTLQIIARRSLLTPCAWQDGPRLLLEGSWEQASKEPLAVSLDEAIDHREAWIDDVAADMGQRLSAAPVAGTLNSAYLNALPLRYYLVKLLRVIAYFERFPLSAGQHVQLHAAYEDVDYQLLLEQICRQQHAQFEAIRYTSSSATRPQLTNPWWRRLGAQLASSLEMAATPHFPRVVLCGNRRLLDPVCAELVRRRANLWWLYDRFAWKCWGRWLPRCVNQIVLNSDRPAISAPRLAAVDECTALKHGDVELWPAIRHWLTTCETINGETHARIVQRLQDEFARVQPTHIVLDEDCTPLARAVVAIGRQFGAKTAVLQNGAPGVRFGYVPLEADQVMAWGESSHEQYIQWGVPPERIAVTGSPWHDGLIRKLASSRTTKTHRPRRVGVFLCPPARDQRPDLVTYHKTSATYRQMLEDIFAALAELEDTHVWLRPHPRHTDNALLRHLEQQYPQLPVRRVSDMPLAAVLENISCAVSMASSSGVEAALAGVPVVQMLPAGSGDLLPADRWGMQGTARSLPELRKLLAAALAPHQQAVPSQAIFANLETPAAETVVDRLLTDDAELIRLPFRPSNASAVFERPAA